MQGSGIGDYACAHRDPRLESCRGLLRTGRHGQSPRRETAEARVTRQTTG